MTPHIDISSEREGSSGWSFGVRVSHADGAVQRCMLKLSFADYNHWSASGTDAPAHVARAVISFFLEKLGSEPLPEAFDASLARRMFSEADAVIPTLIRA